MNQHEQTYAVNLPEVAADLNRVFDDYEAALVRNDVAALDRFFWQAPQTVRYGVAENLYGGDAIRAYRATCSPVHPGRRIIRKVITTFGCDVGTASVEFDAPDSDRPGRQMQTWIRFPEGWKVVAAHVSLI